MWWRWRLSSNITCHYAKECRSHVPPSCAPGLRSAWPCAARPAWPFALSAKTSKAKPSVNLPGFIWREPEIAQSLTNRPRSTCQHPHPPVLYAPSRVSKVMAIRLLHCRKAVPNCFKVRCPSGRRSTPGKCVYGNVSRVRIPPSPPNQKSPAMRGFFVVDYCVLQA